MDVSMKRKFNYFSLLLIKYSKFIIDKTYLGFKVI